ncbi:YvrJ family protein [bacterium]|nr:YvrJ family protein [bacterium]
MEELFKAIANWGFPIVVSVYLLVRIESKIESLESAIKDLSVTIARINGTLSGKD